MKAARKFKEVEKYKDKVGQGREGGDCQCVIMMILMDQTYCYELLNREM